MTFKGQMETPYNIFSYVCVNLYKKIYVVLHITLLNNSDNIIFAIVI